MDPGALLGPRKIVFPETHGTDGHEANMQAGEEQKMSSGAQREERLGTLCPGCAVGDEDI